MIEILPHFWITSLKKLNTSVIHSSLNKVQINTCKKLDFIGKNKLYSGELKIKILKNEIIQLYKYIENVLNTIHQNIMENVIIVVCKSGNQISPLIATCYLIKYGNMNDIQALNCVKSKYSGVLNDSIFFDNISKKIFTNYNEKQ